jgi:hypothetical protein
MRGHALAPDSRPAHHANLLFPEHLDRLDQERAGGDIVLVDSHASTGSALFNTGE